VNRQRILATALAAGLLSAAATADVCNVKVVTDASPDYHDLPSMVLSITSRWPTTRQKCWALFYWNHIARRQTSPMILHGMALTDPIRQANDYGYTMCSTIAGVELPDDANGAYEVLIRVELFGKAAADDALPTHLTIPTTTMLNPKTQPRLTLGRNTVYVGAGDQTDSIVFWPELQGGKYKDHVAQEKNIACDEKHIGCQGVVYPKAPNEDAHLVYRIDAPRDLVRVTYGGRFYNRAPKSRIENAHSLDGGKTWTTTWSLTDTKPPWDVIHYETAAIPASHRAVWIRYRMHSPAAARSACGIYAVRMEANHLPADAEVRPIVVPFRWSERQKDRSLVQRDHLKVIEKVPCRYVINVGSDDHPVMDSLRMSLRDPQTSTQIGYSDGKDVGGTKRVGTWLACGKNLAAGRPYTLSTPSETGWGAGDPDGRKRTDGVAGPPYAGGISYRCGALWSKGKNPVITLDLGKTTSCAAFGMNFHGYPWWDALKGAVRDKVEVLVSTDGEQYTSLGFLKTDLRWKDLPVNHMWPDHEVIQGATLQLIPTRRVEARYVEYRVTHERFFCATELEVLDAIRSEPFDLRIALPE